MLKKLYRAIIPEPIRKFWGGVIYDISVRMHIWHLWELILVSYIGGKLSAYKKEIKFIVRHGIHMFPYNFVLRYGKCKFEVLYDNREEKNYVLHRGKRLYFPKNTNTEDIRKMYLQLIMEQDIDSPHRYWSKINEPEQGDILVDVGASEGLIALEWIDVLSEVILIECNERWRDALQATFEPYKDKVSIINKYCSNLCDQSNDTIDNIVRYKSNVVIKMDIEGAEIRALDGAGETLQRSDVKWAVCTYHTKTDAENIEQIMLKNQIRYEFSEGYLLLPYDETYEYPFFRKAMIRGKKF